MELTKNTLRKYELNEHFFSNNMVIVANYVCIPNLSSDSLVKNISNSVMGVTG